MDAQTGGAEITGSQGEQEHILVAVDGGIYNVRKATCGVICVTCNGVTGAAFMVLNPFAVAVGGNTQQALCEQWNSGNQYNVTSQSKWTSSNTSVATVSSGLVHGVAAGSLTLSAQDNYLEPPYVSSYCTPLPGQACPVSLLCSAQSQGNVATPTNFTISSESDLTDGSLFFRYTWSSSSGNKEDIASCSIGESVFYPNFPTTPYVWPLPMVASTPNPTVPTPYGKGSDAEMQDTNYPPSSYTQPYFAAGFDATQRFWWSCPGYNNGNQNNFVPDIKITRKIFKDSDGFWKYQITKSGYVNTIKLPNQ